MASSSTLDIGYPVFAARFRDEKTLVVGGGGGEGKHGVKNKISVITIEEESLKLQSEIELESDGDNATSLDVKDEVVYAGVNRKQKDVESGKNDHLRVLDLDQSKQQNSKKVFEDVAFQKCTCIYGNQLAIASSTSPSKIYTLNTRSLEQKGKPKTLQGEINDLSFSPSGKRLLCVEDNRLLIIDANTKKEIATIDPPEKGMKFTRARYVNDEEDFVAMLNVAGRKGVVLALYNDNSLAKTHRMNKVRGAGAMDASERFIAVATSDLSIHIFSTDLTKLIEFKDVHAFAITDVVISNDEAALVSVSAASTVNLIALPADGVFHSTIEKIWWIIASLLMLALVAFCFYFILDRQIFADLSIHELSSSLNSKLDEYKTAVRMHDSSDL